MTTDTLSTYLVTIRTDCGMYEETIDAATRREAARKFVQILVDEGEIDLEEHLSYHVEELDL